MTTASAVGPTHSPATAPPARFHRTVTVPGDGTEESWIAAGELVPRGIAVRMHSDETTSTVLRTNVDVDAYTRHEHVRIPVDLEALATDPEIPPAVGTALAVLHRLEGSALAESRAMLPTWTGNEARITAFLASWMVQRHWQARALRDVLTGDDPVERPLPFAAPTLAARLRRVHVDRLQPLIAPLWTFGAGEATTAGHMARMAIQEASLLAGLRALAPHLSGEARRVVDVVSDHHEPAVRFFTTEAIARITRSRREAVTARVLLSLNSPLDGGGVVDPDLPAALAVLGAQAADRAALHRARFEITRLLPGPALPDPYLRALSKGGA